MTVVLWRAAMISWQCFRTKRFFVCQVSNLSGTNSEEATERAAKAVALAFSSLIPFRILKMPPASYRC